MDKGFRTLNVEARHVALPEKLLQALVEKVTKAVPTDSIYIFGSYARGEQGPDSDVDVYVVGSDPEERWIDASARARRAAHGVFSPAGLSFDILCFPRPDYEARRKDFWNIEHAIDKEGVLIYG